MGSSRRHWLPKGAVLVFDRSDLGFAALRLVRRPYAELHSFQQRLGEWKEDGEKFLVMVPAPPELRLATADNLRELGLVLMKLALRRHRNFGDVDGLVFKAIATDPALLKWGDRFWSECVDGLLAPIPVAPMEAVEPIALGQPLPSPLPAPDAEADSAPMPLDTLPPGLFGNAATAAAPGHRIANA
ncbi:hypothetical protein RA210_U190055 [Rubrivivax sp. A210]|uniref:hypothetical protein n=1 Tax=Rubrivivax sp. A210 TaxID=2772301 RepID=UPI00191A1B6C|nr:hypothetical protein [Rubrivivax sp. A210]CAD5371985.1 hypothetical protein RA210_U190055 [Rubrivivax sp. A210]